MASVSWKKERNLKVSGSTIKQGLFRGWKSSSPSGLLTHDIPTEFTPEYIDKLYNSINGHVPIVVDHAGKSDIVGYTYQTGITTTKDDIQFKGFVFDETAEQKIIREGYTYVSPEIVEETDRFGNVTPKLLRIALVKNPAIEGTDINIEPIVFSKGDVNMTEGEEEQKQPEQPKDEGFGKAKPTDSKPESQKVDINLNVRQDEKKTPEQPIQGNDVAVDLAELKAQNVAMQNQLEKMLTERYDGIVAELKRQGIEDPGKIVQGLPLDHKISVLSKMLGTVMKTKPVAEPSDAAKGAPITGNSKEEINKAVAEVLEELGYTVDEYREIRGEK